MSEQWIEDELPWLDPLPPSPRRNTTAASAAGASAIPRPAAVPNWQFDRPPAGRPTTTIPPYARKGARAPGHGIALRWVGVLLVIVAVTTALALMLRDSRATPATIVIPTAQLVIPTGGGGASDPESVVAPAVANAAFAGKVVCIDAAHGGLDRGYQRAGDAAAPAMDEALYTAAYARDLAGQLSAMGFTVLLTRDGDTVRNAQFQDVNRDGMTSENAATSAEASQNARLDEMQSRIDYCNDEKADLLLSLHFDGSADPALSGYETWYAAGRSDSQQSQFLAQLLDEELGVTLTSAGYSLVNRGVLAEDTATSDASTYESLFMITGTRTGLKDASRMPGAVVDILTISNAADAQILASGAGREAIVTGLAQAVGRYFEQTPPKE